MTGRGFRWLGSGLVASAGAGVLAVTSMMNPVFAYADTVGDAADPTAIGLVMGGSGDPIPGTEYVDIANSLYIAPNFPDTTYPGVLANGLFTPEGFYPLTGVNSLPFNYPSATDGFPSTSTSAGQGLEILNDAIRANLNADPEEATTVFGYSQSATIASLEMEQLDPSGTQSGLPAQFVLIGDPNAPNGGLLERFDSLIMPSLGFNLDGATPADDFPTVIYSLEYDGAADFPQYPLNFLADLNAVIGFALIHTTYLGLTPAQIATAIKLPTSGATETTYYMIPTTDLPLLDPVRDIPVIGNPIADLLQPDL
ncbi:MAG: PE-PPE domain-containing protein, partial [Mycobacterium sp.]